MKKFRNLKKKQKKDGSIKNKSKQLDIFGCKMLHCLKSSKVVIALIISIALIYQIEIYFNVTQSMTSLTTFNSQYLSYKTYEYFIEKNDTFNNTEQESAKSLCSSISATLSKSIKCNEKILLI